MPPVNQRRRPGSLDALVDLLAGTGKLDKATLDVLPGRQGNETNQVQSLTVLVSESGEEGSFEEVGAIADCPTAALGPQGEFQLSVSGMARYVRVVATKKTPSMTIGEVRIWGSRARGTDAGRTT